MLLEILGINRGLIDEVVLRARIEAPFRAVIADRNHGHRSRRRHLLGLTYSCGRRGFSFGVKELTLVPEAAFALSMHLARDLAPLLCQGLLLLVYCILPNSLRTGVRERTS